MNGGEGEQGNEERERRCRRIGGWGENLMISIYICTQTCGFVCMFFEMIVACNAC